MVCLLTDNNALQPRRKHHKRVKTACLRRSIAVGLSAGWTSKQRSVRSRRAGLRPSGNEGGPLALAIYIMIQEHIITQKVNPSTLDGLLIVLMHTWICTLNMSARWFVVSSASHGGLPVAISMMVQPTLHTSQLRP